MGHPCPPQIAAEEDNQPSSSKKVLFDKYELGRLLGCGAFAKVYHAREVSTGQSVAIKCFNKNKIVKSNLTSNITREISIMRWLQHPNIVRLFEVLASRTKIYFVMEFVKGGELLSRLETGGRCNENLARRYFRQLVSAVGYCHTRGVFHRDLKPENLLIDENGDLKISDFGLSAVSDHLRQDGMFHTLCGTPAYVAPEILSRKGYDGAKVDIWSCGVILFVLVAGYLPFNDSNLMAMYRKIYRGEYKCPKWTSTGLKHLIARLLDTNPSTRITIDGILNDPWFRKDLSEKEFAKLSNFHRQEEAEEKKMKKKVEFEVNREMNAFDIISLSPGFNLSGLFEPGPSRERFLCGGPVEEALVKLEREWAKEDMMIVKRRVEDGVLFGLEVKDRTGRLVLRIEVHRFNRDVLVVEVDAFGKECEARFRPALDGLRFEPVSSTVES